MQHSAEALEAVRSALAPDLEVLRALGSGASAVVYLAREPGLQRLVAVKVLREELLTEAVTLQRFQREAQAVARIAHPNVLTVFRIGHLPDGPPYIVMEYVEGRTVADMLAAGGLPDEPLGRRLVAQVAAALAAAHAQRIVHRDVRPGNVFVHQATGRAVLGDFGIAALVDTGSGASARLTAVGVQLGQTRYLSPEQLKGEAVTPACDVYALGLLAYEVLTGEGPFEARAAAPLMMAHLQAEPRPLASLRSDVAREVASVVERCLAKDPNHRPLAQEVAERLAPAPVAEGGGDADGGALYQLVREARRRRVYRVMAGYGAAAFALLGGAEIVYDAFALPRQPYQVLVAVTLAGFPVALVLGWVFDVDAGNIRRTGATQGAAHTRGLAWAALLATAVLAAVLGWLLLRP